MSFDGRLLHGAPALQVRAIAVPQRVFVTPCLLQPLPPDAVRVTFLANVRVSARALPSLCGCRCFYCSMFSSGVAQPSPSVPAAAALLHRQASAAPPAVTRSQPGAQRVHRSYSALLLPPPHIFLRTHRLRSAADSAPAKRHRRRRRRGALALHQVQLNPPAVRAQPCFLTPVCLFACSFTPEVKAAVAPAAAKSKAAKPAASAPPQGAGAGGSSKRKK
jgi:hypothetical protein